MQIERIDDANDPRLADYRAVQAPRELARKGLFVAESRGVVVALLRQSTFRIRSVLTHSVSLAALEHELARLAADTPVFVAEREVSAQLVGFDFHRGCLALAERGPGLTVADLIGRMPADGQVVALDTVANPDNVGSVFRNAAAFGANGVVLREGCADPLYRKAIRTSMGAVLHVPFAVATDWTNDLARLRAAGFRMIALTPHGVTQDIDQLARRSDWPGRQALVVGNEGEGLGADTLVQVDERARIAMRPGMDSVNVATATGIAMHLLFRRPGRE